MIRFSVCFDVSLDRYESLTGVSHLCEQKIVLEMFTVLIYIDKLASTLLQLFSTYVAVMR